MAMADSCTIQHFCLSLSLSVSLSLSHFHGTSLLLITRKRWPSFLYSGQEILADCMETKEVELTVLLSLVSLHTQAVSFILLFNTHTYTYSPIRNMARSSLRRRFVQQRNNVTTPAEVSKCVLWPSQ